MKILLLALLVGLAALAGLTLSAAAQPGGDGADDADPQGRIIARIQDRTGDDGVDDYRIEFGFFPEWAMDDKDPWSEAVATWSDWLPRARYLTKAVIDRRADGDNRRWLRSSLISVPASAQPGGGGTGLEDDGSNGQSLIEGRVIARYHPDSRGRLRIEFGFLPEWAFIRAADTEAAVEQYGGDLLPRSRYISASMIESRRGVWLRSSVVELTSAPVVVIEQAPAIDSISCAPSQPDVDEAVTCTAALSGGDPNSYAWSGGDSGGDSAAYNTTFSSSGAKTVSLTVTNSSGSDSDSTTLTVEQPLQAPAIDGISCSPASPTVGEAVACSATLSGGAPDSWAWSGGDSGGDSSTYNTSFSSAGDKTVSLTATNSAGSDSGSTTVSVAEELQPPEISISCPSSADVDQSVACTASNSGGAIDNYAWSDSGGGSGSSSSYSTSFSSSGDKTVSLTATNSAGSDSDSTTVSVAEELQPPEISISCPSSADVDQSVACTVSNSGGAIDSYNWRDSDGGSGSSSSYSTSFSSSGAKIIRVTATNSAGSDSASAGVNVIAQPVITVSCPSAADTGETITCTVGNSGGAINSYSWRDSDGGSGSGSSYSTSFGSSGAKTIRLTVRNAAGSDSDAASVSVTGAPQISVSCPSPAVAGESVACTVSNSGDAIDSYAWSDSDGGSGSGSSYSTSFSSSGAKTVSLTARNSAGSDSASVSVEVRAPPISISCPSAAEVNETITCMVSSSGGAIDNYAWSTSDGGSGSGSSYWTSFSTSGAKTIRLTVRSSAGSSSDSTTVEVRARPGVQPPVITISCPPTTEAWKTFTCSMSNSGGAIDLYDWSTSDGSGLTATARSGLGRTYTDQFFSTGAKTVSLTARNSAGSDSASTTVEAIPTTKKPIISIACTSPVVVDESVSCAVNAHAGATVTGGWIETFSWSDSDGGSGSGPSYSTSFSSSGAKTVSLTASNAAGSDSDSTTVEVRAASP